MLCGADACETMYHELWCGQKLSRSNTSGRSKRQIIIKVSNPPSVSGNSRALLISITRLLCNDQHLYCYFTIEREVKVTLITSNSRNNIRNILFFLSFFRDHCFYGGSASRDTGYTPSTATHLAESTVKQLQCNMSTTRTAFVDQVAPP